MRQRLIGVVPGQQHRRGDETDQADKGEGLGEAGDEHERGHDDANGDDQPQRRQKPRPDLPERPHDGLSDPPEKAGLKDARFGLIAHLLLPALRNKSFKHLDDCH